MIMFNKNSSFKKFLILSFLFPVLILSFTGCGKASETGDAVDMSSLFDNMLAADNKLPEMTVVSSETDGASSYFSSLCDFDYDEVSCFYYAASSDGTASEIALIKLNDPLKASSLMKSLKSHISARRDAFVNYNASQVEYLDDAVLIHEKNYVALIISPQPGSIRNVFGEAFK